MMTVSLRPVSLFGVPNVHRMAEACSLCACRSCAQLRQSPGFARFPVMRLVDAPHLSHEHWVRSICSKQLSGLEITILVDQFLDAENKLLLWLWVSHSREKWKQESEIIFLYRCCVCVQGQRVVLLLIDEIRNNVDRTLSIPQGRAH